MSGTQVGDKQDPESRQQHQTLEERRRQLSKSKSDLKAQIVQAKAKVRTCSSPVALKINLPFPHPVLCWSKFCNACSFQTPSLF